MNRPQFPILAFDPIMDLQFNGTLQDNPMPQTVSTGKAIVGVNATALEALDILRSGKHPGYVIFDLTKGYR